MRRRLLRGLAAAALAVAVSTAGAVMPARAATIPGDVVLPPPGPTVRLAISALGLMRSGLTDAAIAALIDQAVNSALGARNEVISHIDALEAARSRAEAESLIREFLNYPVMRQTWQTWTFASDASRSASLDYRQMQVVGDSAADEIGHSLNAKYPMAEIAAKDAGWTQAARNNLRNEYIAANEWIAQNLEPTCTTADAPLAPPSQHVIQRRHTCTAANGDIATANETYVGGHLQGTAVNVNQLKVDAAINSSWVVAIDILPDLPRP